MAKLRLLGLVSLMLIVSITPPAIAKSKKHFTQQFAPIKRKCPEGWTLNAYGKCVPVVNIPLAKKSR